jgi:hypothetical protein
MKADEELIFTTEANKENEGGTSLWEHKIQTDRHPMGRNPKCNFRFEAQSVIKCNLL